MGLPGFYRGGNFDTDGFAREVCRGGSTASVERFPRFGIAVHRDVGPGMVLVVSVAMVGLPGHGFLA